MQRRRRHALVLHAAYAAGIHRPQKRRLQLRRHLLHSVAEPQHQAPRLRTPAHPDSFAMNLMSDVYERRMADLGADLGAEVLLQGPGGGAGQLLAGDIHQGAHLRHTPESAIPTLQHAQQQLDGCMQESNSRRAGSYAAPASLMPSRLASVELMG